jgi:hypothetical protein
MVTHTCNPTTWDTEGGGSQVRGQPRLDSSVQKIKIEKLGFMDLGTHLFFEALVKMLYLIKGQELDKL